MKTTILSQAVRNELNAIKEVEQITPNKKRINIELICAIGTMLAIIGGVIILNSLGLIREF